MRKAPQVASSAAVVYVSQGRMQHWLSLKLTVKSTSGSLKRYAVTRSISSNCPTRLYANGRTCCNT